PPCRGRARHRACHARRPRAMARAKLADWLTNVWKRLAGEPGFEPGLTESESAGLPLTYSPIRSSLGPAGAGHGPTAAIRRSFPIGGRLVTTFGLAIK